jgi:hypothetical protein
MEFWQIRMEQQKATMVAETNWAPRENATKTHWKTKLFEELS